MSMNVVEKSRRKSVFGRNSKAAMVVPTGGPRNQSTGDGHRQKMIDPNGCLADKPKNDKDEV
jgi:hypothetical protein